MHFYYSITNEQYLQMLESTLRQKESSPFRITCFLFLTLGQSIWVVYMLLSSPISHRGKVFLVIWSLIMTAINVIFRCTRKQRARIAFDNLIKTKQISPDYWEPHSLFIDGNLAELTFGKTQLDCLCTEIEIVENSKLVYLYSHGIIFDLIPGDYTQKDEILRRIRNSRNVVSEEFHSRPENADQFFLFELTGKEFKRIQTRIYQSYFINKTLKSSGYIIKLMVTILLCYYLAVSAFSIRWILSLCVMLYLNFSAILCITPITDRYLRSKIDEFKWIADNDTYSAEFLVKDSAVFFSLGNMKWLYSLKDIEFVFSEKYGIALFTGIWPAGFIPSSQFINRFKQDEFVGVLKHPDLFNNTAVQEAE